MTEKIYGNTPTFLGAKKSTKFENINELDDVLIYGVPWEGAVTWGDYTGCELGPKAIRLCSARYSGYLPERNHIDVLEHLNLVDVGDLDVVPADVDETVQRITDFSEKIYNTGLFPIAFGGDHGITYPIIKGISNSHKGKKIGVIHLDAHYDNMPSWEGDPFARCSPFARLYELDAVRNESILHTGIHGPRNKPEAGKFANAANAKTITVNEIRQAKDLVTLAEDIYMQASENVDFVYLSICSDVLDFAFNPGGPVDGNGLTTYELVTLVYEFCKKGIIGMDFVEIYPQQDPNNLSAHVASTIILHALAGVVENKNSIKHSKREELSI